MMHFKHLLHIHCLTDYIGFWLRVKETEISTAALVQDFTWLGKNLIFI